MEYLGFWVTWNGTRPVNKKLEAIVNMTPSKNIIQVCALLGLVSYYRDMWSRQLHLLQPLTALTSTKVTFKWTDAEKKSFDKIEQLVARNTLLIYPD